MTEQLTEKSHYKKAMHSLQADIEISAEKLAKSKRSLILVFEGMDASGKSGCIKRITRKLDTRQYRIIPISKPTTEEYKYHYLRRFWTTLPAYGKIAIYDRSWYGRVLVERIEGFCTEKEWQRAYHEICEFEKALYDDGAIIVKFWLDVSENEQLNRFRARKEDPAKAHKITEEDWRNRAKRPEYERAKDDMVRLTTEFAPWHIIPADDKKSARLKAAEIILATLEKFL